jgi:predicted peptidase
MVAALKAAGGDPKFTVYPDAGHDSWTATYNDEAFWTWLLSQKRKK